MTMNRFALYSTFVLSAIAASIITSDFDIQSVRRVLSTKENAVDNKSTPNSAVKRNVRRVTKDSEASSSSKQSNQKSKTSGKNKREEITVEESSGLRGLKSGTSPSEEVVESDASQKDEVSSSRRSKSMSSKAKETSVDIQSERVEVSQDTSKNALSRQKQSEDSEEKLSTDTQRKAKGGSVLKKSDESSLVKKSKDTDESEISEKNEKNSGDKRDLTSESENEQDNGEENTREFRRGGRAMSKESLDIESDEQPKNKGTKTALSNEEDDVSKDSSSAISTEDENDSKEFRRGGRAMSLRISSKKKMSTNSMESDPERNNKKSMKKNSKRHASDGQQKEVSIHTEEGTDPKLDDSGNKDGNTKKNTIQLETTKDAMESHAGSIGNEKSDPLSSTTRKGEDDEDNNESNTSLFSLADSTDILPGQAKVDEMVKEFRGGADTYDATNKHTEKERYYRLMYGRSKPVKSSW